MMREHFLKTVSYLPHVKEPMMKGYLSCRDTFSGMLRCPLKTGFTVFIFSQSVYYPSKLWSVVICSVYDILFFSGPICCFYLPGLICVLYIFRVISLEHIIEQYNTPALLAPVEKCIDEQDLCGPTDIPCQLCQVQYYII